MTQSDFPPTRAHGLQRLAAFAPHAGESYTSGRNTDFGPDRPNAVSKLSVYLRHRLITEQEAVANVLSQHNFAAAEKYVQEVLWRTYWKGWLEMRPAVWARFLEERDAQREGFVDTRAVTDAESGQTGIDGFDDWARELVATGYLHNHARMWFASIWIFTLRLPWALGADFFLRHLIDADAASNTLSWRWVAGLQTIGKTYLATADNIARYTGGRFAPKGLAREALTLIDTPIELPCALPETLAIDRAKPSLLLVTHEDMYPEFLISNALQINGAINVADENLLWGKASSQFVRAAMADISARVKDHFGCAADIATALDASTLIAAAQAAGVTQIVTPYAPVGPVADALVRIAPALAQHGIPLIQVRRDWDRHFWPHAQKGFFPFREQIPKILAQFGIA
jgi:deoxyribodipyrimidine photo-lyase